MASLCSSPQTEIENMASSSEIVSPQPSAHRHYDAFISHRGTDVKKTLGSHIWYSLVSCGLDVFLDKNEMEEGELIIDQIRDAIRNSSVHITIFSENYAESQWCMRELCWMMEDPEKILPVFYNVEPCDLRRMDKDGPYAKAMRVHETKGRHDSQTLKKWKDTLAAVADRSGYELKTFNSDEGELVKNIVDNVLKRVKREPWDVAKYPVGLNEIAEDFEKRMLQARSDDESVRVVGIVGMGGLGKTTLATHIFNAKRSDYGKSCFLADVRSKTSLTDLQSDLLKDLTGVYKKIGSINEGIGILRDRLKPYRALVILDDIDRVEQLEALLVVKDVLRAGSLIVVTSRDKGLLEGSDISLLYAINKLSKQRAQELFCWHAFRKPFSLEGFEELLERFLNICDGLPLSLKVFGALLYGNNDRNYWQSQLEKLSQKLSSGIKEKLKLSYDVLEENEQDIFLDIASFFIGEDKNMAIKIWDGCGCYGSIGLQILEKKCLVEFDDGGCIKMHDHLRDLGRDIIDEDYLKYPHKPRRLWRPEDIGGLLKQRSGPMQVIRGIKMIDWRIFDIRDEDMRGYKRVYNRLIQLFGNSCSSFVGFSGLKLLVLRGGGLNGILRSATRDPVWLRWHDCPYKSLPSWILTDKLRVLELHDSFKTSWHGFNQLPAQLRELSVHGISRARIPKSIGQLQHLEKIDLRGNRSMKSLPDEFCQLQSLKHLSLDRWNKLELLPKNFGGLSNLQHLNLTYCWNLQTLPDSFNRLIQLQYLCLKGCWSLIIPTEILGNISTLEYIDFSNCLKLEMLPSQITHQTSLREMRLNGTRLKELPDEIGELSNLQVFDLFVISTIWTKLPPSIWTLSGLRKLVLGRNHDHAADGMTSSGVESFEGGVEQMKNLEHLKIRNFQLFKLLPFTTGGTVAEAEIRGGKESGRLLPKLHELILQDTRICTISISDDVCPNLKRLDLSRNRHLVQILALPKLLESLDLNCCGVLKTIRGLSRLAKLSELDISQCEELEEVPHVGGLGALQRLDAGGCVKVKRIQGLEQLTRLKDLRVSTHNGAIWNDIRPLLMKRSISTMQLAAAPRLEGEVDLIVNSVPFTAAVLRSSKRGKSMVFRLPDLKSCTAVIFCCLSRTSRPFSSISLWNILVIDEPATGEWMTVGIFSEYSYLGRELKSKSNMTAELYASEGIEVKKGWMVIGSDGEEGKMIEVLNRLFAPVESIGLGHDHVFSYSV